MKCKRARALLELYAGNDLSPPVQKKVMAHVQVCASCQAEYGQLQRALKAGYRTLARSDQVAAELHVWPTVRARVLQQRRPAPEIRFRPRAVLVGAVLSALLLVVVLLVLDLAQFPQKEVAPRSAELSSAIARLSAVEPLAEGQGTMIVFMVDEPPMTVVWFVD
ncbi:MAG: zf-HC2 domain-containing protein [candidate division KSB1 bacterium]|nr:zf-HC2 domain-containing protein [candidate division KSB1 bacterium]